MKIKTAKTSESWISACFTKFVPTTITHYYTHTQYASGNQPGRGTGRGRGRGREGKRRRVTNQVSWCEYNGHEEDVSSDQLEGGPPSVYLTVWMCEAVGELLKVTVIQE